MAQVAVRCGFKPHRTLYRLDFSDTELAGLEVDARGSSMAELIGILEGADKVADLQELDEQQDAGKIAGQLREMVAPFARKLHAWNLLDDDDEPVPASLDGLMSQELDFVVSLISAYGNAMSQAPPPLRAGSASGATSEEEREAMAALSRDLPSFGAAELVIALCDRWHCLPSQVLAEDAVLLRMLDVYTRGHREDEGGE